MQDFRNTDHFAKNFFLNPGFEIYVLVVGALSELTRHVTLDVLSL